MNMHVSGERLVTVFLCGDVMTGRGIDQILPHPSDPRIHEACVSDAHTYVALAEEVNGHIPRPVELAYIWGDALAELQHVAPDARIVNLETSVTRSDDAWPKGINYRMHTANVGCLTAAGIDVCVLANNHVLDYGYSGLVETLETLHRAGLQTAGAGRTLAEARQPAVVDVAANCRVVVHGFGTDTSGIPASWAAAEDLPGIEVYRNRLILYGCGDLINDYEGIRGYEQYRDDLVLMYFATLHPASGDLVQLRMTPMQLRKMRLNWATPGDVRWMTTRLTRISQSFGPRVGEAEDGSLLLCWDGPLSES